MKIFIMKTCPGCKNVQEKIEEYKVADKFTFVDIHDNYEGYIPEQVPVIQDEILGNVVGENIIKFLDKVYG